MEPSGPVQTCNGIVLLLLNKILFIKHVPFQFHFLMFPVIAHSVVAILWFSKFGFVQTCDVCFI
jgi:hypothetical protein